MATLVIDSLPSSAEKYVDDWTLVVVDVIRFTTTTATALSIGRTVYPARSADEAFAIGARLKDPLLAGELGGNVPYGFDLPNSPVQVMALRQVPCGFFTAAHRPIVLVSSSGAQLLMNSLAAQNVYLGCLRNITALTEHILAARHEKVAIIGAGTRGAFRREDQLGCAWIAERLVEKGFECADDASRDLVKKWHGASTDIIREGRSADYLKRTGQAHDLEFVLHYQEDLSVVPKMSPGGFVVDAAKA
jgi:phosphosulfolactate phosphohydrolase-like enzyme